MINQLITVINSIYGFFTDSKLQGSYFLLLILALFALYKTGKRENKWFLAYGLVLLIVVVANPITIFLLRLVFPAIGTFRPVVLLLPIFVYVPYALTEIVDIPSSNKTRYTLLAVLLLFIAICGNIWGIYRGDTMTHEYVYNEQKEEILRYIDKKEPGLALINDELIPFVSSYLEGVPMLYGIDLWVDGLDTGIMDNYDDDIYRLHEYMQNPELHLGTILYMGAQYGCDIIVVDRFEGNSEPVAGYTLAKTTESYMVYVK